MLPEISPYPRPIRRVDFKPRKAALLRFVEDLTCLLDFATSQVVSAFDVFHGKFVRR
jgi:hypothetical protein